MKHSAKLLTNTHEFMDIAGFFIKYIFFPQVND